MSEAHDTLAGRVVLVTGASGFIGTHLCRRLLSLGATVHALSRTGAAHADSRVTQWRVDASDFERLRETLHRVRPEYVFHLASHVMGAPDIEHVLPTFKSNLESTVNLLTCLTELDCRRIVLTGSLVEPPAGELEQTPSSPYAAAKWASAQYARMFHALYGLPVVIARVFMTYGPAQRDLSKLVPYTILSLLRGEPPKITTGARLIDWIYIDDVIEGFLRLGVSRGIEPQSIDLGSGLLISTRQLVETIHGLMPSTCAPQFGALPDRPLEPLRKADTARSKALIDWEPRVDLAHGLAETIAYYQGSASQ
jgi:UDP-glucose 4-epimerase